MARGLSIKAFAKIVTKEPEISRKLQLEELPSCGEHAFLCSRLSCFGFLVFVMEIVSWIKRLGAYSVNKLRGNNRPSAEK